jgi:hypothetical protein
MIDLWNPAHVSLSIDLVTAFLLGLVHGVTPDEHTWPITFSYAVGGYSTRRGLWAGIIFSTAFTVQQGFAGELAYLGFTRWFTFDGVDDYVYIVVGVAMAAAGMFIVRRGFLHRHHAPGPAEVRDLELWMPAVHGFIAGWGFDAFSTIIYTVLSPAMPSAATGWLPGIMFGVGTLCVQAVAGAAFGLWAARRGLPPSAVRGIGLTVASRTLFWGGLAFIGLAIFDFAFPDLSDIGITTGIKVHNLHRLDLPVLVAILIVAGIGMTSLVTSTYAWRRQPEAGT